jgi:DNA-binding protein HU-beta
MLKKEIISKVAEEAALTKKQSAVAIEAFLDAIKDSLAKGDSVLLTGFGKFEVRTRESREGINPRTLEKITLPESKYPAFKAGKALKVAVK